MRIKLSILIAAAAHIYTMPIAFILLFLPIYSGVEPINESGGFTQLAEVKLTFLERSGMSAFFVSSFPWVVTGVTLLSTIMGDSTRSDQLRVLWRWRSYSWGASIILFAFICLSLDTVGLFYIPALILSLIAAFLNR